MKNLLLSTLFLLLSVVGVSVEAEAMRAHVSAGTLTTLSTGLCSAYAASDGNMDNLTAVVNEAKTAYDKCTPGDNPGFYSQDKSDALQSEIQNAEAVLQRGNDAECLQEIPVLQKAIKELADTRKHVADGYYWIVSKLHLFAEKQPGVKMAMYAENGGLNWSILNEESAKYVFKITKLASGNYSIQNVLSGLYIRFGEDVAGYFTDANDTQIKLAETQEIEQKIVDLDAAGQFNLFNVRNSRAYNTQSFSGGEAQSGTVCSWTSGANGEAAWTFTPVTDAAQIQKYLEEAEKEVVPTKIANAITLFGNSTIGTAPGCYPEDKVNNLSTAITQAETAQNGGDNDAIAAAIAALDQAVAAVKASQVPMTEGYYWIWSRNSVLVDKLPDGKFAMNAQGNALHWGVLDEQDGKYAFKITKREDGNYDIQNVLNDKYIEYAENINGAFSDANDVQIRLSAAPSIGQKIINLPVGGQFHIFNTKNTRAYNTQNAGGEARQGVICSWTSIANGESAWSFEPIADENLIQKYKNDSKLSVATEKMNQLLGAAKKIRVKTIDNLPLVTDPNQFSANSSSAADHSSFAHLIDGNTHYNNNFHSRWSKDAMQNATIDAATWGGLQEEYAAANPENRAVGIGYHNLQVALHEPVNKFMFRYIARTGTSVVDSPTDIEIFATNNDELGSSTDQADVMHWERITELTEGFPGKVAGAVYDSPVITMGQAYKYIRFVMKKSAMMNTVPYRIFNNPDITGVTWNVGEFQLYNPDGAPTSEYLTVPGMKEACDALDALMAENQTKIDNKTITLDDTTAITEAIRKVENLYVDRDMIDATMAQVLDSANKTYNNMIGAHHPLIIEPEAQCLSNSSSAADNSSFANLVDNNTNTVFHSRWDSRMTDTDWNADAWAEDMANYATATKGNCGVGYGYHNLQVKLMNPVKKFWIEMTSRVNTSWTDTPNDIEFYVTNNDEAGASADNANQAQWTLAAHLNENMPQDGPSSYKSPVIELDQAYKYIRMVVKGTSHQSARNTGTPDVTGITWNVSELQFYTVLAHERTPYYYNEEMKNACDAMKGLIDADIQLPKHSLLNYDKINELRTALERVKSLIADTTELAGLYKKMYAIAYNTTVGEKVGYAENQAAIDNFKASITAARGTVDMLQPKKDKIQPAIEAINNAYNEFITHVRMVEPGKWYYIINQAPAGEMSSTTVLPGREVHGSALYIISNGANFGSGEGIFNSGYQLRWGMDDVRAMEQTNDASCIWRFVTAPESFGKNVYYLQCLRNGTYIGNSNKDEHNDCYYVNDTTPYPFRIDFAGSGQFNIIAIGNTNYPGPISAGDNARQIRADNPALGINQRTSWSFEPIIDGMDAVTTYYPTNSIQIVSMPFAVSNLDTYNEGVKTYAIHSRVDEHKIGLIEKSSFEAGEPFVMTIGDYTAYVANGAQASIQFALPDDLSLEEKTANGLVATLDRKKIHLIGAGYISDAVMKVIEDGETGVTIAAQSGYIDANKITNLEGTPTLVISTTGPLAVKDIVSTNGDKHVNVYSIDGKLIKKNVILSKAAQGLGKGIYIIGNKKIAVK